MRRIGVKDLKGNNICVIDNRRPLSKDFWSQYTLVSIIWRVDDSMAFMVVEEV